MKKKREGEESFDDGNRSRALISNWSMIMREGGARAMKQPQIEGKSRKKKFENVGLESQNSGGQGLTSEQ